MSELLQKIRIDQLSARKLSHSQEEAILTTLLEKASAVPEEEVTKVLQQSLKNLKDKLEISHDPEVQDSLKKEINIIERFLPRQIDEIDLRKIISTIIDNYSSMDRASLMGYIMKELTAKYQGQYNGKIAAKIAREMTKQ